MELSRTSSLLGLKRNPNPFALRPGATTILRNAVLGRGAMVETRKGLNYFWRSSAAPIAFFDAGTDLAIALENGELWRRPTSGATGALLGSFSWRSTVRAMAARSNTYFTTADAVRVVGRTERPGLPPALDVQAAPDGANGFLSTRVAYRVVWRRSLQQVLRSAPSPPVVVTNTTRRQISSIVRSGSTATITTTTPHPYVTGDVVFVDGASAPEYEGAFTITVTSSTTFTATVAGSPPSPATADAVTRRSNVAITFSVPAGITSADEFEIYRTVQAVDSQASPGDACRLVYRGRYTSGSIVSYVDSTPDTLLGASLYTNTDQVDGGIAFANWRPGIAEDITEFRDYAFYANYTHERRLSLQFLSATGGIVPNVSTIILRDQAGEQVFVFATAEDFPNRRFRLHTSGTPSENIENTMRSFCRAVNQNSRFYAVYVSTDTSTPGSIEIYAREPTQTLVIDADSATTADNFDPIISNLSAPSSSFSNRLYWSKLQQPEHVPLVNYLDIGDEQSPILRIIALRDELMIFKTDGIFYVSGTDPPWTLSTLDVTTRLLAPDSAVRLNNDVYALSNQGVIRCSRNGGVEVLSLDIEVDIRGVISGADAERCFAAASERDRSYLLWVPADNVVGQLAFVFNIFRESDAPWSTFARAARAAHVATDRELYVSSGDEIAVLKQRNTGTTLDYSDEDIDVVITAFTADTITFSYSSVFVMTAGFSLRQNATRVILTEILTATPTTIVAQVSVPNQAWSIGAAVVSVPIYFHARFLPDACSDAAVSKTFFDVAVFPDDKVSTLEIELSSNQSSQITRVSVTRDVRLGWGIDPWGTSPWGASDDLRRDPVRVNVDLRNRTGESLTVGVRHAVAGERLGLLSLGIYFQNESEVTVV